MSAEERTRHEQAKTAALVEYASIPKAMAIEESEGVDVPVLLRGNPLTPGAIVPRRFPRVLNDGRADALPIRGSGRCELAAWITRPENPLTARVLVNRVWRGHFGQGLVRSIDNFGRLGERPDHPELLDWLAVQFVEEGWSIKTLHRRIMLSNVYQMSTEWDSRAARVDPENRWLWRMNRRRLDAEGLRDSLLFVGGVLDLTRGGRTLPLENFVNLSADPVAKAAREGALFESLRRSVYLPVFRSALYDVFQAFDFPDPATMNGDRATTTVPSQALFMLNSPLLTKAARGLGERLFAPGIDSDETRLDLAYTAALGRLPDTAEHADWETFLRSTIGTNNDTGERRNAWESVCRVLLSSNEFIYVD